MSFRSTSDQIFRRIIDKFELDTVRREPLMVPSIIQPVTIIDDILKEVKPLSIINTPDATARTDVFTVPNTERWYIMASSGSRVNAGSITVRVRDPPGNSLVLDYVASGASLRTLFYYPVPLDGGWSFEIAHGAGTSGELVSTILYQSEDVAR